MILIYLITIAVSNVITAMFAPIELFHGALLIPTGSLLVGLTFILRDLVQLRCGRRITYTVILAASALSAAVSWALGDSTWVAIASVIAFLVSESLDTEIFTRVKRSFVIRVVLSGIVGGLADSVIFVVIGLSPIGLGVLSWGQVPYAVLGQVVVKALLQPVGAFGLFFLKGQKR
jgi:uncharacterized PurR-regulated membrane protein YhhQ (DUF165 family)